MGQASLSTSMQSRTGFVLASALLTIAVLLGGGGVAYAINNAFVQLFALAVLALSFSQWSAFWKSAPNTFRLLCVATFALPLLQLIPMPPEIWQTLPGRELVSQTLNVADIEPGWRALSVDSARTQVAVLALLVPIALITLAIALPRKRLQLIGWVIVGLGLLNFVWGIPQVLSQGLSAILYPENPMPGVLFGSFANRNSTSIFLVICILLCLNLDFPKASTAWSSFVRAALVVLLVAGVILTQSRTGIALLAVPFGLSVVRLLASGRGKKHWLKFVVIAGALILALLASAGTRVETAWERFSGNDGFRTQIWEDAAYSADRFWPVGSGMGTFDEVFQIDESLEHLSPRTAGRAHNDYLELAIEGGLFAIALLAAWLVWIVWLSWKARQSQDRWIAWSGSGVLGIVALQSLTDYPLRNLAMLAVAAYAIVILVRFSTSPREGQK